MHLSDELFARVCKSLGLDRRAGSTFWSVASKPAEPESGGGAAVAPSEVACRRETERHETTTQVDFEPRGSATQRRRVALRNLSASGAGLTDDRPSRAGETVVVHLPVGPQESIPVMARVQNSRLTRDGRFRVGVKFIAWAEADEENSIVRQTQVQETKLPREQGRKPAKADAPAGAAERRNGRVRVEGRVEFHAFDPETVGPLQEGRLADVSPKGLAFVSEHSLEEGDKFVVRYGTDQGWAAARLCVVAHCRPIDRGFRIGARFLSATRERFDKGLLAKLPTWFV